jgi:7,8-dihydropterin-6-yl-methyl-4-(beta-D-ribofuranosyl)aminobenzene 5'-phosphate synthase
VCVESGTTADIRTAAPRPVSDNPVDPIALAQVDEVVITTLVDNVYDALLDGNETVRGRHSRPELPRLRSLNRERPRLG